MTTARVRDAAQFVARRGASTGKPDLRPHELAALTRLDERLKAHPDILGEFTALWRAEGSPASAAGEDLAGNVFDSLRPLLNIIAAGEGNYTSINRGRAGDTPGGRPGLDRLTIGEVQALQRSGVFAVGRYQFIPETLKMAVAAAGMAVTDLFSPENQDWLAVALLLGGKRPKLRDYLQGGAVSIEDAQLELAKEWASIPMADGRGFYDGDSAGNRASAKVAEVQRALQQARQALAGKALPQLRVPHAAPSPPAAPKPRPQAVKLPPHLTLHRTKRMGSGGLELLSLKMIVDSLPMAELMVVSGAPSAQRFRTGNRSKAGSLEPLPEGAYTIGPVEWAGGKAGDYTTKWPDPGLGPVWVAITYRPPSGTQRSALGFHVDDNAPVAPGSAGCVVFRTLADLRVFVGWMEQHRPRELYVNWGLGTCPAVKAR